MEDWERPDTKEFSLETNVTTRQQMLSWLHYDVIMMSLPVEVPFGGGTSSSEETDIQKVSTFL